MEFLYKPQDQEQDGNIIPAVFEGVVRLKLPHYTERLKKMKEVGVRISSDGTVDRTSDLFEQAEKIYGVVKEHVIELKLTRKSDGVEFSDLDTLSYDEDGVAMINELGAVLLRGVKLGKR